MGKQQKKHSKGRLDRYYYLAKEKGYRARSSFKIIQINEKYGHFLEKSKVVIDLCAAPGSWCQVASQLCPVNSLIIGVDIVPIKPLPNVISFQSDITTEDCRSRLRGHMKTWKADTVLHDGAPNVGLGWVQDAFTQSQLTLQALKLAVENLAAGGTFVTKIFRSRDYNNLMWVFQQLFEKVEATKPPASRNVSAEIFVVCKGFKAPKKLDPRLLDPKEVFEELGAEKQNNEAKVFNPEKFASTRQRQGYEEGDYTLYHTMPIMEFIKEDDPIDKLGTLNKFDVPDKNEDHEWKIITKLKIFTPELDECARDLKVLGKKEFKHLLRFRQKARDLLGLNDKEEKGPIEVEEDLNDEERIDRELQELMQKMEKQKQKRTKKLREVRAQNKQASKNVFEFDSIFAGLESFGDDIFIQNELDNKAATEAGDIDAGIEVDEDAKGKDGNDNEDEELEEIEGHDEDDLGDIPDIDPIPEAGSSSRGGELDEDSPEFFTLAHKVALGQKHDVIDASFNRNWGFENERAITDGISNAALLSKKALKNKRLLSKKALEAVARKKMKMQKKFEKLKNIEDVSDYNKMVKKISKKPQKKKVTVVVSRGSNRGLSGRPKGVKGKYKMVDGVMKNETRALKRIAKKRK
ncbi:AdoMet-dependent rRNA methyltransferase SPB1 [Candida viswanathii]|uniref:AdoMet-dependent rRNA methyltransferase SPB1 n=1 Tax=Candida viswanathii TaxID=5486 RepID=A0A367YG88_9ASCO|nr:AdoMet-dependent rRNA methyltransferase SPB1 [Candida viswanathii]